MELDELKSLVQSKMERVQQPKSTTDFALLLNKKTNSVTEKIKRNLFFEILITAAFVVVFAIVAYLSTLTSMRVYFSIFAVICLLFLPVLFVLRSKINKLTNSVMPVKSNIETLINIVQEYTKVYFRLTMALIPISLILAVSLGYLDYNSGDQQSGFFLDILNSPSKLTIVVLYLLVFSVAMYYFTRWHLKRLYGNYVLQLQNVVRELSESYVQ